MDSIPVVFPTSNNTATAHSGFSIFHVDNNNNVDDSFNTTNAEEEDEDLFLGDSIANDIGAPPMSRPTCDAHHYADELRPFSVFSLSSHIERQNKAKRIQKLLEMSESELDAHASTEEGRIDLELWLSMENPEAKNSNSTCRADAQRYNAASARHDMISQGIRAHYGIFEEMADLYYADAETLPRKLERIRGNPESALGNSHRSSSTLGSRKHGQKKMRTLSDDESQQLATELLRSERWQSLEQAVSAPETKFSNVWDRYVQKGMIQLLSSAILVHSCSYLSSHQLYSINLTHPSLFIPFATGYKATPPLVAEPRCCNAFRSGCGVSKTIQTTRIKTGVYLDSATAR